MAHLRYFVVDDQSVWKIDFNGQLYGDFQSEREAVSNAIEKAFSDSMSGHKADILIRDKVTGHFKVAWSYGRG
jgi:hypothetical protein